MAEKYVNWAKRRNGNVVKTKKEILPPLQRTMTSVKYKGEGDDKTENLGDRKKRPMTIHAPVKLNSFRKTRD